MLNVVHVMSRYNVVFDLDRQRVGIARSRCGYDTEETRAKCNCPAVSKHAKEDIQESQGVTECAPIYAYGMCRARQSKCAAPTA